MLREQSSLAAKVRFAEPPKRTKFIKFIYASSLDDFFINFYILKADKIFSINYIRLSMYDEKDIKKILTRAIELQRRTKGAESDSEQNEKLSLEEIEKIAQESGLAPEYVRQAAFEFEGIPVEEPLFKDTGNRHEIELMGFAKGTVDQKTWIELRAMIEYHFDNPGKVKLRPDSIIWKAQPKGILKILHSQKSPVVEVSSSDNKSTIKIKKSLKTHNKLFWPSYAALGGAAMLLAVAMMEAPEALFFSAGLLVLAKIFHYWAKNKINKIRGQLKETMEQLQTIITRRSSTSGKVDSTEKPTLNIPEKEEIEFKMSSEGKREKA